MGTWECQKALIASKRTNSVKKTTTQTTKKKTNRKVREKNIISFVLFLTLLLPLNVCYCLESDSECLEEKHLL